MEHQKQLQELQAMLKEYDQSLQRLQEIQFPLSAQQGDLQIIQSRVQCDQSEQIKLGRDQHDVNQLMIAQTQNSQRAPPVQGETNQNEHQRMSNDNLNMNLPPPHLPPPPPHLPYYPVARALLSTKCVKCYLDRKYQKHSVPLELSEQ